MKKLILFISVFTFFILATTFWGCISYYSITKDSLVKQLKDEQVKTESSNSFQVFTPATPVTVTTKYIANRIEKILCRNSDGELVYVYPNQNTELEFTSKSTHDVVTMYFDTVYLEGTKIQGLRSRIITSMTREIEISDIEKIEIYTEMSKTEKYKEN